MKNISSKIILFVLFTLSFLITTLTVKSQNEEDALRYSINQPTGTARFSSMGGAFTALGGDISSIGLNPAGLAIYRKSEFTFTPGFYLTDSRADYNNQSLSQGKLNLHAGNIGYVGIYHGNDQYKWKSGGFAIGYNRTANYSNETSLKGFSAGSSILDPYVQELNENGGTSENNINDAFPFDGALAYRAFLINPTDSVSYDHVLQNSEDVLQKKDIRKSGGMGEYFLAAGGNYNDQLYIGGSINISNLRYTEESTYREIPNLDDRTNDLVELKRHENLLTRGTGVNFKFGMIGRLADWLRIGTSIHSPTYYRLRDEWSSEMSASYENGDEYTETSPNGSFEYTLHTPARVSGGLAFVIGSRGLLSAEYEYVDYSLAKLGTPRNAIDSESYDFNIENENISTLYQSAGNIKVGTEWRFNPYRIRAGYYHQGNTFSDLANEDNSRSVYSIGVGYRQPDYFVDLGYSLSQTLENHYLYRGVENPAHLDTKMHYLLITVGFRF